MFDNFVCRVPNVIGDLSQVGTYTHILNGDLHTHTNWGRTHTHPKWGLIHTLLVGNYTYTLHGDFYAHICQVEQICIHYAVHFSSLYLATLNCDYFETRFCDYHGIICIFLISRTKSENNVLLVTIEVVFVVGFS